VLRDKDVSKRQKGNTENLSILIESFTADLVNAVGKGKVITSSITLLGSVFITLLVKKHLYKIMNKLGHSLSYTKVCDIETSLTELVIQKSKDFNVLPLL